MVWEIQILFDVFVLLLILVFSYYLYSFKRVREQLLRKLACMRNELDLTEEKPKQKKGGG